MKYYIFSARGHLKAELVNKNLADDVLSDVGGIMIVADSKEEAASIFNSHQFDLVPIAVP